MSPLTPNDEYDRRLLARVASGAPLSQRALAQDLGVALGLTNLLMRRLVRKGWIRIVRIKPNRLLYFITPAGVREKARMSREYFRRSVTFYAETRDRIRQSFEYLGQQQRSRIVFYGAGEVAEVGYVCLSETNLTLVAVVDDERERPFFGLPVLRPEALGPDAVGQQPYDCVAVMSFDDPEIIAARLSSLGVPAEAIHWLDGHPEIVTAATPHPANGNGRAGRTRKNGGRKAFPE